MKEKLKLIAKIIGAIFGLFILWIIFTIINNRINPAASNNYRMQINSTSPMMGIVADSNGGMMMEGYEMDYDSSSINASTSISENYQETDTSVTDKKVIKNGNLSLKVDSTEDATQ